MHGSGGYMSNRVNTFQATIGQYKHYTIKLFTKNPRKKPATEKETKEFLNFYLSVQLPIRHYTLSSIKETNCLSKGMCALLFDAFNRCSLVKK